MLGGWLAYGLESGSRNGIFLSIMTLLVGYVGYFVGYSADLKHGIGQLFAQAFVIVMFGGPYSGQELLSAAISRISGIITGVVIFLLVSNVVFPSTGTELVSPLLSYLLSR